MKKILCLLLALACAFSLFACKSEDVMDLFVQTVEASNATKITTRYSYTDASGEVFNGSFVTEIDGEDFVLNYDYERYATIEEAADSYKVSVEGSVYYKDGKYSEDGETWFTTAPDTGAIAIKFNLDKANLGEYTLSPDGNTLNATLTAEQALAVLGADLDISGTAELTVVTNGKYLTSVSVNYTTASNGTVTLDTSYTYNTVAAE